MDVEDHVAGVETDGGVWVSGEIIEETVGGGGSVLCGFGLVGGQVVEGNEKCVVDCAGVIEEGSDDLLQSFVLVHMFRCS